MIAKCSSLLLLPALLFLAGCGKAPPLSVVQRDSIIGNGKVLIITNTSDKHLHEISIEFSAPNGEHFAPKVFATTLKPHETMEIGWMELGYWTIESGETVTISVKGYGKFSDTID